MFAGGLGSSNSSYYLYSNQAYWTMSPDVFIATSAIVFYVSTTGSLGDLNIYSVNATLGVRPIINLRADVTFTGNGTAESPYEVV